MTRLANPVPLFLDARGALLDAGYVYVGAANTDPEVEANQLPAFWDKGLTVPALQPFRTLGGMIVNGANVGFVFFAAEDYSITVRDANGVLVSAVSSAADSSEEAVAYQPLDSDLTAIVALATTAYGRSLLTLANQAALKSATGIPDSLPLTGGTMSGTILRAGAGAHAYAVNPAFTGFRLCGVDPVGTADATSQPGDFQVFY